MFSGWLVGSAESPKIVHAAGMPDFSIKALNKKKLNYNYIIPFGYYPQIAYALKRLHYIYNIYPFDEINYVTIDVLIDCLNIVIL